MSRELDVQLTAADRAHVAVAVGRHYCKHLDSLATEAKALGKDEEAIRYEDEAKELRAAIVEPFEEGKDFELYAGQRLAVEKGLEMLVKTMKSAKGINRSVGNDRAVEWCDANATAIESSLLPQFREQSELALVRPPSEEAAEAQS